MRKALFAAAGLLVFAPGLRAQAGLSKVSVRAVLVDNGLNQKPVPRLTLVLTAGSDNAENSHEFRTDFAGNAEFEVPPGKYRLTTPQGVDFQGRHYIWDIEATVSSAIVSVDLSNDNARVSDPASSEPAGKVDDLTLMFQKYQNSIVTVWSEIGSGTGFIVDSAGLILTNQHVIGGSELISVQFDAKRKVVAKVLAIDAERDVAVLYADLSAFPGALAVPMAAAHAGREIAAEGERAFTIGSPLGLKKIITSGIVSKVEARAIISDVNINPGNSGGPLFNSSGQVIGITTFGVFKESGPGVAGIVRIEQTQPTLERARQKMKTVPPLAARLLPVEPGDPYPLGALKKMARNSRFDAKPYRLSIGGFDVTLETPVLKYELEERAELAATKEKNKRNLIRPGPVADSSDPLLDRHGWEEYEGEYKPLLTIYAEPQLHEKFASMLGRELIPSITPSGKTLHLNFRTDFYRMRLLCGGNEVEPIHRFRVPRVENDHDESVSVTDATFFGTYFYGPDAISPSCSKVKLEIFSEQDPGKSESRDLDPKSIDRVWNDFRPYLAVHGGSVN